MLKRCLAVLCVLPLLAVTARAAQPASHSHWVGSWAASPMQTEGGFSLRFLSGQTLREVVHLSTGGAQVRLRFSNEFGLEPLTLSDVHVALSAGGARIQDGTDHPVTFGGATSVLIPAGSAIFSDPVNMTVAPLANLSVSFFVPPQVMQAETYHDLAAGDNYLAAGDVAGDPALVNPTILPSWYFFDGIDVPAVDGARSIVALGDSITDGARMTPNSNNRWPNLLAARIVKDKQLEHVSVVDEGISGNRVLTAGYGPSAVARFDRDVLAQDGVRYLIILESINDIGGLTKLRTPADQITARELEEALTQMADQAHQHGIKVYGATLTPFKGAFYWSPQGEQIREAVNQFIRTSPIFDGVIDFDKAVRDPQNPLIYDPKYDSGDHLHPGDAGYQAMADAVNLALFKANRH